MLATLAWSSALAPPQRARSSRRRRTPSFATRLQQARTVAASLELLVSAGDPASAVAALERCAALAPRADEAAGASLRGDARLVSALGDLASAPLLPDQSATILWSLGMIWSPSDDTVPSVAPVASRVAGALAPDAVVLAPHTAATAVWGCDTLGLPPPRPLAARAALAPFQLHVSAVAQTLDALGRGVRRGGGQDEGRREAGALAALVAEIDLRREIISSGSAEPSAQAIREDRATAWLSESGIPFAYAGKEMAAEAAPLQPAVRAIRDAVSDTIGRHYCSVLVNHYADESSGMRFHADPGQGESGGWGYSTSVVSVGATRQFVFRGIDDAAKRATFRLRHGDVMHMFADCQQAWQHSVVRERPGRGLITQHGGDGDGTAEVSSDHSGSARISLVFKRSLAHERERERFEPPDPS